MKFYISVFEKDINNKVSKAGENDELFFPTSNHITMRYIQLIS